MSYQSLAEVPEQQPHIGRNDLYCGGTSYDNHQGSGKVLKRVPAKGVPVRPEGFSIPDAIQVPGGSVLVAPVNKLYDQGNLMQFNTLLDNRKWGNEILIHPDLAENYRLQDGDAVHLDIGEETLFYVRVKTDGTLPASAALVPRSCAVPLAEPRAARILKKLEKA